MGNVVFRTLTCCSSHFRILPVCSVWGQWPKPETGQRPEHYETHKHTAVCGQPPTVLVDPPQQSTNPAQICSSGPDRASPVELLHLGEPNSGIILAYTCRRMEQGPMKLQCWGPPWYPAALPLQRQQAATHVRFYLLKLSGPGSVSWKESGLSDQKRSLLNKIQLYVYNKI